MAVKLPYPSLVAGLVVLTIALFILSLIVGPSATGIGDVARALIGLGDSRLILIVTEIRLPRAILGVLVGAALGVSGAALQGFLRNPLAEPGLIGISGGAALGAVLALYFGLSALTVWAVPAAALVGAGIAVLLVILLAGRSGTLTLILAGIAISSLASALMALALNLAPSPYAIVEIVFWMLGSLADRSNDHVLIAAPFVLVGMALLLSTARGLEALTLGDDVAATMGFSPTGVRLRIIVGASMAVGASVAVSGIVGFVGLVAPHLLRRHVGYRPGPLLLVSALAGAALVLAADTLVRLMPGGELKLGVVTALLGAPIFFHMILDQRRRAQ